jgi:hypothetical protein
MQAANDKGGNSADPEKVVVNSRLERSYIRRFSRAVRLFRPVWTSCE